MSTKRSIAVIGASNDRSKFGNRAVRAYRSEGWIVYPVHPSSSMIEGMPAFKSILDIQLAVDRVSLYLPPQKTLGVLEEIARKGVGELFLNPGTESAVVLERAEQLGLHPILACSIVDIGRSPANPD